MTALRVHAIIYSWPRVQARAFEIAAELFCYAHKVSVVTCNDDPVAAPAGLDVVVLPNSSYFGQQFQKTIEIFDGDILLQVAADTSTQSWGALVRQCETRFQTLPKLAIWTPDIDGTTWPNEHVFLYQTADPTLFGVVQTDCIVWALRRDIVDYLKTLDMTPTPLGWGIDWAAIAHAYANDARVMRDLKVKIHHELGTGYNRMEANRQKDLFLNQLADPERIHLLFMSAVINSRAR